MKKKLDTGYLLDFYGPLLTGRQREALDMYYNMDYSLSEIAEEFGVTRQCVHRFILQGEKRLLEMETALGHAALYAAAEKVLSAMDGAEVKSESLKNACRALSACMEREANGI